MNIRLTIEYDGEPFFGWQRQEGLPTVQGEIERALAKILGEPVTLYGASRTDTGVHARGQVANFHATAPVPPERWAMVLNSYLPPAIRVTDSREVPGRFNARNDACSKVYEYRLLNRARPSALDRRLYHYPWPLDWEGIRRAMPHFVGKKDFRALQAAGATVKTTVRSVSRFDLVPDEDGLFRFVIEGDGFLKQMVRAIVGTLLEVGEGKRDPAAIPSVIESGDRRLAGRTAPGRGLTLVEVSYFEKGAI